MPLTSKDLQRLVKEPSGENRSELASKIAQEFTDGEFNYSERQVAIEIFRLLIGDVEERVRKALSTHLAHSMDVPHDIVLKLANDVSEVAMPLLKYSYVLTEEDLIAITQSTKDVAVMSTIARRDSVSRGLSKALLTKANSSVIESLLQNKGASIDEDGFQEIYKASADIPSILELMVKRGGLPVTLAEKLFVVVSDELKKTLTEHYNLSMQVAEHSTNNAREFATLGLVGDDMHTADVEKLVDQLYDQGRLTLSFIIRSLCQGDMRFFEYALAKLADIPVTNAQILILDQGEQGFESLYKGSCLPAELFPAIHHLLKVALEETSYGRYQLSDFKQRLAQRLLQDDDARHIEYMDYLITLIQNNNRDALYAS